jgi:hypothetical protein
MNKKLQQDNNITNLLFANEIREEYTTITGRTPFQQFLES